MDKVKLELTIEQANVLTAALSKLPIDYGLATFTEVQKQLRAQVEIFQKQPASSGVTG